MKEGPTPRELQQIEEEDMKASDLTKEEVQELIDDAKKKTKETLGGYVKKYPQESFDYKEWLQVPIPDGQSVLSSDPRLEE